MITIKTEKEIGIMREGGKILAIIIRELEKEVKPGIPTNYLDKVANGLVFKFGAEPSFKGYQGSGDELVKPFPAALCVSINDEIVHGVPSERILKEGDIVSLDLGILYKGFHTDMAITLAVGKIPQEIQRLIKTTKKSLKRGIKECVPGNIFADISKAIQKCIEIQGFSVVRELCGHGIGKNLHEDPEILNYFEKGGKKEAIRQGMVFCLEPMATMGDWQIKKAKDGFSYKTKDGSLSSHFEHTIAITKNGTEILTK